MRGHKMCLFLYFLKQRKLSLNYSGQPFASDALDDGLNTYDFTSLSRVFQSYQSDGRVIMKDYMQ